MQYWLKLHAYVPFGMATGAYVQMDGVANLILTF
jgi:hypothetical protein